ncbi:MAG: di-heme enzyme [Polyangiaceae bacterium]
MTRRAAVLPTLLLLAACSTRAEDGGAVADGGADAASDGPTTVVENDYTWTLPAGFPKPVVPKENPISVAKIELGRRLFYDTRLSGNGTQSCATCHEQKHAFADTKAQGVGSTGEVHPRGPMSLANVGYANTLTWANDVVVTLERQALVPMFGEAPVELGLSGKENELFARLRAEPYYVDAFPKAFPGTEGDGVTLEHVVQALATFERVLVSGDSKFDRAASGKDPAALDASAKRGQELFFSERMECFHCHGGFAFADSVSHEGKTIREVAFHNTALYNVDGQGGYPVGNRGLFELSQKPADMGRFKAPSLRNIAVTAPYMHDGTIASLEDVIDHYARGGRNVTTGPNVGDGAKNPLKSEFLKGFLISPEEKVDLVHFLESLTDDGFLVDPRFADPWPHP